MIESQFTADHNHWSSTPHPAVIKAFSLIQPTRGLLLRNRLVDDGVEQSNDVPFDFEGMWNCQFALEQRANPL